MTEIPIPIGPVHDDTGGRRQDERRYLPRESPARPRWKLEPVSR